MMGRPRWAGLMPSLSTIPRRVNGPRLTGWRSPTPAARAGRYVAGIVLLAGAYYGAAKLGLKLGYLDGAVTALWPPVGVGIAALVLFGPRLWPGVVLGDLLVADFSTPLGTVVGQTAGNTLEVLVGALLLRRLAGADVAMNRVRDVFALIVAAAAGTLISACFGTASLRLGDVIGAPETVEVWRTWWLSDFSGALVVTPAILAWAHVGPRRPSRGRLLEGAALADRARAAGRGALPARRALRRLPDADLGRAALRPGGRLGGRAHRRDADRLEHREQRRPVRPCVDHRQPALHAALPRRPPRSRRSSSPP